MSAKHKILVVDDEDDVEQLVRQKFRRQVRDQEYEFLFAKNGVDALVKLQDNPDTEMVFSDINMPEMDGLTLLSELRKHPKTSALPVVVVSTEGSEQRIELIRESRAGFVRKPFTPELLVSAVVSAVGGGDDGE